MRRLSALLDKRRHQREARRLEARQRDVDEIGREVGPARPVLPVGNPRFDGLFGTSTAPNAHGSPSYRPPRRRPRAVPERPSQGSSPYPVGEHRPSLRLPHGMPRRQKRIVRKAVRERGGIAALTAAAEEQRRSAA